MGTEKRRCDGWWQWWRRRWADMLQHPCLLTKNNLVKKVKKVMTSITFDTVSVVIAQKNTVAYYYISALSCHTAFCRAQQWQITCWRPWQIQPWPADTESRRRLRSASSTSLDVQRTRLSTVGNRAFPVRLWNSLPSLLPPLSPSSTVVLSRISSYFLILLSVSTLLSSVQCHRSDSSNVHVKIRKHF